MKICHICTGFSISFQGGITNYVRSLAESQQNAGHNVWVVSRTPDREYNFNVKTFESSKIRPFTLRAMKDKNGLKEIRKFFEAEKFDIIHIHMMMDIDWDFYKILKNYNYVVSLHDYFFLCPRIVMMKPDRTLCTEYDEKKCEKCISWFDTKRLFSGARRIVQGLGWKKFDYPNLKQNMTTKRFANIKQLLENANVLLPVSNRVKEIYENSEIKGNYQVLHIGNITADSFDYGYIPVVKNDKINIIMIGNMNYYKGADLFIKLAQSLDREKYSVHFYGKSGEYSDKLKEVEIIDHGVYKQNQLSDILAESDIGCLFSVWEDNGPQVVMEMLNNHIPVLGTKMGGIPDFIDEGVNGFLFDPYKNGDFENLISILNQLTKEEILEMKRNIKPTMTTKEHEQKIVDIYNNIINQK